MLDDLPSVPQAFCSIEQLGRWIEAQQSFVDLRSEKDFEACHFQHSTNIPRDVLPQRINELPPRGAVLSLFGSNKEEAKEAVDYLQERSYVIAHYLYPHLVEQLLHVSWNEITRMVNSSINNDSNSNDNEELSKNMKLFAMGTDSKIIWTPSPLLAQNMSLILSLLHNHFDKSTMSVETKAKQVLKWTKERGVQRDRRRMRNRKRFSVYGSTSLSCLLC